MYATEYPYAGLILPDASDLDPRPYLNAARRVLAKLDPHPNGGTRTNAEADTVHGGAFGLRVEAQEDSDYGPRIVLEVVTSTGTPTEDEAAATILSDTVLQALNDSPADIIEWYSPDVLLDAEDFIRLRSYVSPKRQRITPAPTPELPHQRPLPEPAPLCDTKPDHAVEPLVLDDPMDQRSTLAKLYETDLEEIEITEPGISADLPPQNAPVAEETPEEKSRLSAASWLMASLVAIVALPMGVAMFIIGLYRGMDFRLVSQVTALTVLFAVLYNTDRLHMVLRQLVF